MHAGQLLSQKVVYQTEPPVSITVTASPFTYQATRPGSVVVSGGTVSLVEMGRAGTFTGMGLLGGVVPVWVSDSVKITYVVAPTMTFIPS